MTLFVVMFSMTIRGSEPTEQLRARLLALQEKGIMIGHQDDPFYGTTWKWDLNRSDVKEVCGEYPAVMGFELGRLELDSVNNIDGVPFKRMQQEIVAHHLRGGIITISWHPWNPVTGENAWDPSGQPVKAILGSGSIHSKFNDWLAKVADFLKSLRTPSGQPVPVIFRPWHEMHGGWFWWGKNSCTPDEYKQLFRYTSDCLGKMEVTNCLYCYSPGSSPLETEESYLRYYPGDEYVDMLGIDIYAGNDRSQYIQSVKSEMAVMTKIAADRDKLICLSETGQRNTTDPQWFTKALWEAVEDTKMSYLLLWRNAWDQKNENFGPAPEKSCADDFRQLHAIKRALFVSDIADEPYRAASNP